MENSFQEAFGKKLTMTEVARLTGIDVRVIKRNYRKFGGIDVGGRLIFFEKEVIRAIQRQIDQSMDCPGEGDVTGRSHQA